MTQTDQAIVFRGNYTCAVDGMSHPSTAVISIDKAILDRVPAIAGHLKQTGMSFACKWHAADFELQDEDGLPTEPEYVINDCTLKVHDDGDIAFLFPFKHSHDEGYVGPMNLSRH